MGQTSKTVRIIVFHYHFLPGGVTQVVKSSAVSLFRYLPDIEGITLVSGEQRHLTKLISETEETLDHIKKDDIYIDSITIPELGYISNMKQDPDSAQIAEILLDNFAGELWWIHNYHIGKNPFFTEALLRIAEGKPEQNMVFQLHDFPEEARYSNLSLLKKHISAPLYPVCSNVRYVTINNRDRENLIKAGIPEKSVFLLNNPVEKIGKRTETLHPSAVKTQLNKILSCSSGSYVKNAPSIVYPVRAIRRKNILEAGLLARCCRIPVNLLVTLPGVSQTETGYSTLVDECFGEQLIPGISRAGIIAEENKISFKEIIEFSSLIMSSSVQEGFGYLFINSLQWQKPLFARKLGILSDFEDIFKPDEHFFYEKMLIPLNRIKREKLRKMYRKKMEEIRKHLDKQIVSNLADSIELMLKQETLDFSFLSPVMQRNFLREITDPGVLRTTQELNLPALEQMENLISLESIDFDQRNIEKFSLRIHAGQIEKVILSFETPIIRKNPPARCIEQKILQSYGEITSIRLLGDPL